MNVATIVSIETLSILHFEHTLNKVSIYTQLFTKQKNVRENFPFLG